MKKLFLVLAVAFVSFSLMAQQARVAGTVNASETLKAGQAIGSVEKVFNEYHAKGWLVVGHQAAFLAEVTKTWGGYGLVWDKAWTGEFEAIVAEKNGAAKTKLFGTWKHGAQRRYGLVK